MTHHPEGCSYSAIAFISNSFPYLSDYGQIYECKGKDPVDKVMENVWIPESWGLLLN
jgi:hypothetical protein